MLRHTLALFTASSATKSAFEQDPNPGPVDTTQLTCQCYGEHTACAVPTDAVVLPCGDSACSSVTTAQEACAYQVKDGSLHDAAWADMSSSSSSQFLQAAHQPTLTDPTRQAAFRRPAGSDAEASHEYSTTCQEALQHWVAPHAPDSPYTQWLALHDSDEADFAALEAGEAMTDSRQTVSLPVSAEIGIRDLTGSLLEILAAVDLTTQCVDTTLLLVDSSADQPEEPDHNVGGSTASTSRFADVTKPCCICCLVLVSIIFLGVRARGIKPRAATRASRRQPGRRELAALGEPQCTADGNFSVVLGTKLP